MLRKVETFVFLTMFLALPFFAMKVVEHAKALAAVKLAAVDLKNDLIRSQEKAKTDKTEITVTTESLPDDKRCSYTIQDAQTVYERITMPRGMSLIGKVTFGATGTPETPSSFLISEQASSVSVNVDAQGLISVK